MQIEIGLSRAKAQSEIWPVGHGFWVPNLGQTLTQPAQTLNIALLPQKIGKKWTKIGGLKWSMS